MKKIIILLTIVIVLALIVSFAKEYSAGRLAFNLQSLITGQQSQAQSDAAKLEALRIENERLDKERKNNLIKSFFLPHTAFF